MIDGYYTITQSLFDMVTANFPPGEYPKLLEIGSGAATQDWVDAGYDVTTVEHDAQWLDQAAARYVHAPLENRYYAADAMLNVLGEDVDILLIDGPPGHLSDRVRILDLMKEAGCEPRVVVVDDTHREDGSELAAALVVRLAPCNVVPVENDDALHEAVILHREFLA